jgi:hypothetical protein
MNTLDLEGLFSSFIKAYEAKDLEAISLMFAPDVKLRDWNSEVEGKDAALAEFSKYFEQASSLEIRIGKLYLAESAAAAELEILVNNKEQLRVVDAISFNILGQITSIIAYKGL